MAEEAQTPSKVLSIICVADLETAWANCAFVILLTGKDCMHNDFVYKNHIQQLKLSMEYAISLILLHL